MKKSVAVSYDADRLYALTMYLGQKELTIEGEMEKQLDGLYQKLVPQNVRDFLEMKEAMVAPVKQKPVGKVTSAVPRNEDSPL